MIERSRGMAKPCADCDDDAATWPK